MRGSLILAAAVVPAALGGWASAAPRPDGPQAGPAIRAAPHPPGTPHSRPRPGPHGRSFDGHNDRTFCRPFPGRYFSYGYVIGDTVFSYGVVPYSSWYPYYAYYPLYDGAILPPLTAPAAAWFGPAATQRFMSGMVGGGGSWGGWQPDFSPEPARERPVEEPPPAPRLREAPAVERAIAQAWKTIGYGDALFAKQDYAAANDRYRKAARTAPQLPDAWFRQAFALSAIGRHDLAVSAVKRGLKLDPQWPTSGGFSLDDLFGADEALKTVHLDALYSAAVESPHDANLLFMAAVHLWFDGQSDRAAQLFARARRLLGRDSAYVAAFENNPGQ